LIVPKDHKCQACGEPAVMAVAGDHGPVYFCAKHLPAGISFAPPGQATPPAAAAAPAVIPAIWVTRRHLAISPPACDRSGDQVTLVTQR